VQAFHAVRGAKAFTVLFRQAQYRSSIIKTSFNFTDFQRRDIFSSLTKSKGIRPTPKRNSGGLGLEK
ncbi:hypothetical protein, partial [Cohnella thermotolerans]|uniref:hypothetical protein n=1 Tax=Cohnella thermotolerans TaxID=329858 RepID=UPI001969C6CD